MVFPKRRILVAFLPGGLVQDCAFRPSIRPGGPGPQRLAEVNALPKRELCGMIGHRKGLCRRAGIPERVPGHEL